MPSKSSVFQSAPLTKARGDAAALGLEPAEGVSIRSPHKSKGRLCLLRDRGYLQHVSIRSPHKSKGRLLVKSSAGRRTIVSIRSPHKSKGRQFGAPRRP